MSIVIDRLTLEMAEAEAERENERLLLQVKSFLDKLIENQQDCPLKYEEVISKYFWELV